MIELPDFSPLRATATSLAPSRAALDRLDHLLFVAPHGEHTALARLPYGKSLATLLARARKNDDEFFGSRAPNARGTGLTAASGQHKGGLAHVPTEITGFGVRLTVELLTRTTQDANDLRKRLDA